MFTYSLPNNNLIVHQLGEYQLDNDLNKRDSGSEGPGFESLRNHLGNLCKSTTYGDFCFRVIQDDSIKILSFGVKIR